jgi:catechol 2,3-dioxygenase-like lactoylglutathione lyase family enzyme
MDRLSDNVVLGATVLRVRDVSRSAEWYRDLLGVDVTVTPAVEHPTAVFRFGQTLYSLWQLTDEEDPPRGSVSDPYIVAVVPENLDAIRAGLEAGGARVTRIGQGNGFRFFRVRDPDGNLIEISSPDGD